MSNNTKNEVTELVVETLVDIVACRVAEFAYNKIKKAVCKAHKNHR